MRCRHSEWTCWTSFPEVATSVRGMALRAELAAVAGDQTTARHWARERVALWSAADPELQPHRTRMHAICGYPVDPRDFRGGSYADDSWYDPAQEQGQSNLADRAPRRCGLTVLACLDRTANQANVASDSSTSHSARTSRSEVHHSIRLHLGRQSAGIRRVTFQWDERDGAGDMQRFPDHFAWRYPHSCQVRSMAEIEPVMEIARESSDSASQPGRIIARFIKLVDARLSQAGSALNDTTYWAVRISR